MDFSFTEEQHLLRESLRAYLRDHYRFEHRRAVSRGDTGWSAATWSDFAERLGLFSLAGAAADPVDLMVVMEELGSALVLEPFLETVVIGSELLRASGGPVAAACLGGIVAGDVRLALAWAEPGTRNEWMPRDTVATKTDGGWVLGGRKSVVMGAPWATSLIVSARTGDGVSLFLVPPSAPGVTLHGYATIDGRRAADVTFADVRLDADRLLGKEGGALPLLERVGDTAIAALGAEALGVMRRMLDDTIDYTRTRHQFGQPISNFQVLQHRMVDMFMQIEMATSAVYLATLKLGASPAERARAASVAQVTVAEACRFVGQNAVQLHGGMGMTDELALGHYFKRATVIEAEMGTVDFHVDRFARLQAA